MLQKGFLDNQLNLQMKICKEMDKSIMKKNDKERVKLYKEYKKIEYEKKKKQRDALEKEENL